MYRRIIASVTAIALAVSISVCAYAEDYPQFEFSECGLVSSDSNSTGAYMFGIKGKTLYSTMFCPQSISRSVSVDFNLKSAIQSADKTYGLYSIDKSINKYGIVEINKEGKACIYEFTGVNQILNKQFSVSDNCVFFTRTDKVRAYIAVYNLNGNYIKDYDFDDDVYSLFNNNGITYAMLYNGKIFSLSKSKCKQVAEIEEAEKFTNAGCERIFTENGRLINLADGSIIDIEDGRGKPAVCGSEGVYLISRNMLEYRGFSGEVRKGEEMYPRFLLVYGDNLIYIKDNYNYKIINNSSLQSINNFVNPSIFQTEDNENKSDFSIADDYIIRNDKYLCGVSPGTKISEFKDRFNGSVSVSDKNGNIVNSGNVRSGYVVSYDSFSLTISVKGDLTGEGNVKSNDVKEFMKYFVDSGDLTELQVISADYNLDDSVGNADLVMLARYANGQ